MSKTIISHVKNCIHTVYVGRPSKWGNPFTIGKDGTREQVIQKYHKWILKRPDLLKDVRTLKGQTLGCWCFPKPCHADILVSLAENALSEKEVKHE